MDPELAALVPAHVGDLHVYQWLLLALIGGGPFLVIGLMARRRAQEPAVEVPPERSGGREAPDQPQERL